LSPLHTFDDADFRGERVHHALFIVFVLGTAPDFYIVSVVVILNGDHWGLGLLRGLLRWVRIFRF
jgi:hypothetical protein